MADSKITQLLAAGNGAADDLVEVVQDVSTTPVSRKQTAPKLIAGAVTTNGLVARTAAAALAAVTITGTTNQITVTNGDGVAGNPTISLPNSVVLPGSVSTDSILGKTTSGTLIIEGAAASTATSNGGSVEIYGAVGGATSGHGGSIVLDAGSPTDGDGGSVTIRAKAGVGTNRSGGNVQFRIGAATGSGVAGRFEVITSAGQVVLTTTYPGQLQVPVTGSGAGILIGGDVQLYRSGANVLTIPDSVTISGGSFAATGAGQHAIGGGISTTAAIRLSGTQTGGVGSNAYGVVIDSTVNEAASGTHPVLAGVIVQPTFVGGAAATTIGASVYVDAVSFPAGTVSGSSVYIENATSGATNNYALWVDDGFTRLDGNVGIGVAPVSQIGCYIASTVTATTGGNGHGMVINPTIVEASSGAHTVLSAVNVLPTFTNGAATAGSVHSVRLEVFTAPTGTTNASTLCVVGAPTGATNNYAMDIQAGSVVFGSAGVHAIGSAPNANIAFLLNGTFAGSTADAQGMAITSTLTPGVGLNAHGLNIAPAINEAASGTHALFTGLRLAPTFGSGAASVTEINTVRLESITCPSGTTGASTLYIGGAPTNATNMFAIYCSGGTSYFGGDIRFNNDVGLKGNNSTGASGNLIYRNSSDQTIIGEAAFNNPLRVVVGSSASIDFVQNGVTTGQFNSSGFFKLSNTGGTVGATAQHGIESNQADGVLVVVNTHASSPNGVFVNFNASSPDNNSQWFIYTADSTTARMVVWADGDITNHDGTYGTISDEGLKTNMVAANSQWEDTKALANAMINYETVFSPGKRLLGWGAQTIRQISPGVVRETTMQDGSRVLATDDMTILKKGFKSLGEALVRIEQLEAEVALLKAA